MHLLPKEELKLTLHAVGSIAQKRLARGVRLNTTEATALIASVLQELIRDGKHSVGELMDIGKKVLGRKHVLPSVPYLLHEIQVEGTFPDGTFLVTVHDPIASLDGDIKYALYGSFLPEPDNSVFANNDDTNTLVPGQVVVSEKGPITINENRDRIKIKVSNLGDRPIQVGSHYHFSETNKQLSFDRGLALGKRLDIIAGTAVRFEPGESKTVQLVTLGGKKLVTGGNNLASGFDLSTLDNSLIASYLEKVKKLGFSHAPEDISVQSKLTPATVSRESYASIFGPTTGDRVRLGDTELWIQIEKDLTTYGDECKFGGGKVLREGMGQATDRSDSTTLDLVLTNALIVNWDGIYKADIGVKNGMIVGVGKAGNPDVMDGVSEGLVVGANTEVVAAEKMIVTAGALDAHVHYICPQLWTEALAGGTTTLIGGGTGPAAGTNATTCTPGKNNIQMMMTASDGIPMNFLFTGKGNDSGTRGLKEQIEAGCGGLKLHEDWGSTPAAIDACLQACDEYDVQCNIHTDTLNESCFFEDTMAAINGRTIQFYHVEGAGGGHSPDIMRAVGEPNVLPSSTNPTRPYATNTLDEHLDMLMVCHHLDRSIPEDIAFAESRIRAETIAAEDVLHDSGAISIISSDSQAMGRIGEVVSRTWRTAAKMKALRGALDGDPSEHDNGRVKRYIAKYTINVAITHGISHKVGDISPGKLADLVLWHPSDFGIRPFQVIKGGVIAWSLMGDANASIPTVQPVLPRPMWGAMPGVAALNSLLFVSQVSLDNGNIESYRLKKKAVAVKNCRNISKKDMKLNNETPKLTIDPETYKVMSGGEECTIEPATKLPLTQNYMLF